MGTDEIGVYAVAVVPTTDVNASSDPYANVFDNPELDLIYLVEIETHPPQ